MEPKVFIKELSQVKLNSPNIVEGFPGIGMVGPICASFMAEKLEMKLIACLSSPQFPPISAIHDYKPVSPARIYASEKYNLVVLLSEFVIPANLVYALTDEVLSWSKKKKAKAIYSLAAIASPQPKDTLHGIASTDKMAELLKSKGIDLIKEGATQGVSGVLVTRCAMEKFPAANIMVQTNKPMDPVAGARLIDKLEEILGFDLDTKPVIKEGEKVQERMKQAIEKMQEMNKGYQKMEANPMYG